jgi:hypothetical protein
MSSKHIVNESMDERFTMGTKPRAKPIKGMPRTAISIRLTDEPRRIRIVVYRIHVLFTTSVV